jgi:hypothetical protein
VPFQIHYSVVGETLYCMCSLNVDSDRSQKYRK